MKRAAIAAGVYSLWIVAFALLWLWLAMSFDALIAYVKVGHWPSGRPHDAVITYRESSWASGVAGAICIAIAASCARASRRVDPLWRFAIATAAIFIVWGVAMILFRVDPGGITNWAFD